MSKDEEFEEMLEGLDIVAEALDEEPHAVLPRINPVSYTHLTLPTIYSV